MLLQHNSLWPKWLYDTVVLLSFLPYYPYLCIIILNLSIMKTIEELKKEQYEAKAKLHELVELINSDEFYGLSQSRKNIIGQRRMALEMYLNSLTKELYDSEDSSLDMSSAMWPLLMSSIFSSSSSFRSTSEASKLKEELSEKDFEDSTLSGHAV